MATAPASERDLRDGIQPLHRIPADEQALLSDRVLSLGSNTIRELLKIAAKPEIISFAGGLPDPNAFPDTDQMRALFERYLAFHHPQALQYGETIGYRPLREAALDYLREDRVIVPSIDNVMITTGSQEALFLLAAALINRRSVLGVEAPTYLGMLQAANTFGAQFAEIPMDEDGVLPGLFEAALTRQVRTFYLLPNHQNPTGVTLALERRKKVALAAKKANVIIIEDDPYGKIHESGEVLQPIQSIAPDNVAYVTTVSKILAPGLRIGILVAPTRLIEACVKVKQGVDLFTSTFDQAIACEYLRSGMLLHQLNKINVMYNERRQMMACALQQMPEGTYVTSPRGGLFFWVQLPYGRKQLDIEALLRESILEDNVAFVPGFPFFANPGTEDEYIRRRHTMRLNFSNQSPENIREGIGRLTRRIRETMSD